MRFNIKWMKTYNERQQAKIAELEALSGEWHETLRRAKAGRWTFVLWAKTEEGLTVILGRVWKTHPKATLNWRVLRGDDGDIITKVPVGMSWGEPQYNLQDPRGAQA